MPEQQFILPKFETKQDWTLFLLEQFNLYNDHLYKPVTSPASYMLFWYNISATTGMRLNTQGFELLERAGYNFTQINLNKNFRPNSGLLVMMDRKCTLPWYWGPKMPVYLMDDKLAALVLLCGNDLEQAMKSFY